MGKTEKILESILESFEKLDSISPGSSVTTADDQISVMDDKTLEKLEEKFEDLEDSLDFLREKEELIDEIKDTVENKYDTLDIEKKELILGYIKSSHSGEIDPDLRHLATEIGKEDLLTLVKEALSGLEGFVEKVAREIELVRENIATEEAKSEEIRRDVFLRKQKIGDAKNDFKESNADFDAEIEKLNILIKELELSLSEETQSDELAKLRAFINQGTKDFA